MINFRHQPTLDEMKKEVESYILQATGARVNIKINMTDENKELARLCYAYESIPFEIISNH